jgi:lipopolysaccharide heptosyltransferase II
MDSSIKSFLIINPFGIGDVIFSTPLIQNLKDSFPNADIFYLCNRKASPVLENHSHIKKIFIYERDEFVAEQKKSFFKGIKKYWRFIYQIRREQIDCAIDLSLNTPFGFFALLSGIKKRYGLDYKKRSCFLNKKIRIEGFTDKHVADYYLDTLKLLDIPVRKCNFKVFVDRASEKEAEEFLKNNNILADNLVVGIAPCGGDAFGRNNHLRRWPAEYFVKLIDRLTEELKAKVFVFAGPKEKQDIDGIVNLLKNKNNVFEFSNSTLKTTIALVNRCQLFISNDTGILRFAEGLDKKIVALYGPIDEKVYGPYFFENNQAIILKKDLACRPCYNKFRLVSCKNDKKCLRSISVDEVMKAASKLLNF